MPKLKDGSMNANDWCKINALNECVRTMIWFDLIWEQISVDGWSEQNTEFMGEIIITLPKILSLVTQECVCSDNIKGNHGFL